MSEIYKLTKSIHNEIERINQKLGLNIKIENDYVWYNFQKGETVNWQIGIYIGDDFRTPVFAIQTPQIRQILVALQEVLGKTSIEYNLHLSGSSYDHTTEEFIDCYTQTDAKTKQTFLDYDVPLAKILDDKWLGAGIERKNHYQRIYQLPLFDREPETVLKELLEILKTL